jgi:hypothetical protein
MGGKIMQEKLQPGGWAAARKIEDKLSGFQIFIA